MRARRVGAGVVLGVLVTQAVIGCGGSEQVLDAYPPETSVSAARSAEPAPNPSAVAAPPVAGQDISECADGDCRIAVSEAVKIRFKGPFGPATLAVTEVGPDLVEYTVKSHGGQSTGVVSGPGSGCVTVLRRDGSGNSCGGVADARPSPRPGAVVIQLAARQDGTAVIDIVSG